MPKVDSFETLADTERFFVKFDYKHILLKKKNQKMMKELKLQIAKYPSSTKKFPITHLHRENMKQ